MKNFVLALAVLIGTTVGAGIFGIPYAIVKSGIIPGFFYFIVLGGTVMFLHLFLGEIVLRTEGKHRLIGYAQKYLGKREKLFVTFSTIFGIIGSLLAYIIIGGNFLKIICASWLNIDSFYFSLFLGVALSLFIFRGIKLIAPAELLTNILFFSIIFIIFLFALPKVNFQNFTLFNPKYIFLPYGILLFSFVGWTAIPEINDIFKAPKDKKNYKKIIILASIIVVILYSLFALTIIGISGKSTTEEALLGLEPFLGPKVILLGALFGLIVISDSILVLALYLRNALIYDYNLSKNLSFLISCGAPLILFLIGFRSFIETIGLIGTVIGALEGIAIILIFRKAKKLGDRKPEYNLKIPSLLMYLFVLIFIIGTISQVVYYLKDLIKT